MYSSSKLFAELSKALSSVSSTISVPASPETRNRGALITEMLETISPSLIRDISRDQIVVPPVKRNDTKLQGKRHRNHPTGWQADVYEICDTQCCKSDQINDAISRVKQISEHFADSSEPFAKKD